MRSCYEQVIQAGSPGLAGSFIRQKALYLHDTKDWSGPIAALQVDSGEALPPRIENAVVNGWIQLHKENSAIAEEQLANARNMLAELKNLADAGKFDGPMSTVQEAEVIVMQLDGLLAVARRDHDKGLAWMREAVALELELPFGFGPPQPAKPSLELLGETLVSPGHLAEAREVLKTSLSRTPNKALSVAALAKTD